MKYFRFFLFSLFSTLTLFLFFSCQSLKTEKSRPIEISRKLLGKPMLSAEQLADFFLSENPDFDRDEMIRFAGYYIDECAAENLNSDVAFAQMCHETGFLRFGNLVQPEQHNYCGLGATGPGYPGASFETEQLGVRAHVQHLQAYATTEDVSLNRELIDPRYSWVHKTKLADTIFDLTGVWATDPLYGEKIDAKLSKMEMFGQ